MFEHIGSLPAKTKIAGILFIIAFFLKIILIAIVFNSSLHWLGYIILAVAFASLFSSVILCTIQMKVQEIVPSQSDVEKWMKHYNLNK